MQKMGVRQSKWCIPKHMETTQINSYEENSGQDLIAIEFDAQWPNENQITRVKQMWALSVETFSYWRKNQKYIFLDQ